MQKYSIFFYNTSGHFTAYFWGHPVSYPELDNRRLDGLTQFRTWSDNFSLSCIVVEELVWPKCLQKNVVFTAKISISHVFTLSFQCILQCIHQSKIIMWTQITTFPNFDTKLHNLPIFFNNKKALSQGPGPPSPQKTTTRGVRYECLYSQLRD